MKVDIILGITLFINLLNKIISLHIDNFTEIESDYQKGEIVELSNEEEGQKKLDSFFIYYNPVINNTLPLEIHLFTIFGDTSPEMKVKLYQYYSEYHTLPEIKPDYSNCIQSYDLFEGTEIINPVSEITLSNSTKPGFYYFIFNYESKLNSSYEASFAVYNPNINYTVSEETKLTFFNHPRNIFKFIIPSKNTKKYFHLSIIFSGSININAEVNIYDINKIVLKNEIMNIKTKGYEYFPIEPNKEYYIEVNISSSTAYYGYLYRLATELVDGNIKEINSTFNSSVISNNIDYKDYMYFYLDCSNITDFVYLQIEENNELELEESIINISYVFTDKYDEGYGNLNYKILSKTNTYVEQKSSIIKQYSKIKKENKFLFLRIENQDFTIDLPNLKITNLDYKGEKREKKEEEEEEEDVNSTLYIVIFIIVVILVLAAVGGIIFYCIKKKKDSDNVGSLIPMDNNE